MNERWIALHCGDESSALLATHPNAFLLLCQVAMRAKWKPCAITKLAAGQALIGDWREAGLTSEKTYRHAKQILQECGLVTFEGRARGTVATLMDTRIFSVSKDDKGGLGADWGRTGGELGADKGRAGGELGATNHTDTQTHGQTEHTEHTDTGKSPDGSILEVFDAWRASEGLTKIISISEKRKAAAKARMKNQLFRDRWREGLELILKTPFLMGENKRGWKADIDWFLSPDSLGKILEGKYDCVQPGLFQGLNASHLPAGPNGGKPRNIDVFGTKVDFHPDQCF